MPADPVVANTATRAALADLTVEDRLPLSSVGLVCICGKAVTSMEDAPCLCEGCGRLWMIAALELAGPGRVIRRSVYGVPPGKKETHASV